MPAPSAAVVRSVTSTAPVYDLRESDADGVRELFRAYGHRDYQLHLLGITKDAMVGFLWDALAEAPEYSFVLKERGRITGLFSLSYQRWLSKRLGTRTWSVRHLVLSPDVSPSSVQRLLSVGLDSISCLADFVYGRAASSDIPVIVGLQGVGFETVGGEICGVLAPGGAPTEQPQPDGLRFVKARTEKLDEVARIARQSHDINHFAYDPRFPAERVAALYEGVVRFDAADQNGSMMVAEKDGAVVGFHTYRRNRRLECYVAPGLYSLNYIGVDPEARLRGLGEMLTWKVLEELAQSGARGITVRTMLSNYRALATLRKVGARIASANLVFHRWLPPADGPRGARWVDELDSGSCYSASSLRTLWRSR